MAIKCMCKWLEPGLYSYIQGPNNLHEYTCLSFGEADPRDLQELKMEERVATLLDHSLILDYTISCDDQSTLA